MYKLKKYQYGALRIEKFLKDNDIGFIPEKTFEKCRNINKLPFDFYIPKFNLIVEYDGEHHFKPIIYNNSYDRYHYSKYCVEKSITNFESIKRNDKIKNEFCKINRIKLLRISYKQKDRIEEILNKVFLEV